MPVGVTTDQKQTNIVKYIKSFAFKRICSYFLNLLVKIGVFQQSGKKRKILKEKIKRIIIFYLILNSKI